MMILFLIFFLICSSYLMLSYSYVLNGLNRTITNTPKSIFETAIPLTTHEEMVVLYFDQKILIQNYNSYLEKEVTKYVENYEVNYYFYNTQDGGFCDVTNCQGVEIEFSASIMFNYRYQRVMDYEIEEGIKQ